MRLWHLFALLFVASIAWHALDLSHPPHQETRGEEPKSNLPSTARSSPANQATTSGQKAKMPWRPTMVMPDEAKSASVVPTTPSRKSLDIPYRDVDAACGSMGERIRITTCVKQEQSGYDFVRIFWDSVSDDGKKTVLARSEQTKNNHFYYTYMADWLRAEIRQEEYRKDQIASPAFRR